MMRPLIEFIQSQRLEWERGNAALCRPGSQAKLLSQDAQSGARSMLVRYPPGFVGRLGTMPAGDEEIFVLAGSLRIGEREYGQHFYGYLAQGRADPVVSAAGAIVLTFISEPGPDGEEGESIEALDTTGMRWDRSNIDPNVDHLNTARKNLRLDPAGRCRSYLLAGYPQGIPPSASGRLERHPHVEEFFVVYGDLACSVGVMRAGAYSWRPPGVWHGLDCTRSGFLIFFRSPGVNRNQNEWSDSLHPITWERRHAPKLPPELERRFSAPLDDPVEY